MSVQVQDPSSTRITRSGRTEDPSGVPSGLGRGQRARPLFDPPIVRRAITDFFVKLNPKTLAKNPVMFVVEVGAALTTILTLRTLASGSPGLGFELQITAWLW